jgi:uncharacterized protein YbaP (TraB family)
MRKDARKINFFFAVGAAHLGGNGGIPQLLQTGILVEPVLIHLAGHE